MERRWEGEARRHWIENGRPSTLRRVMTYLGCMVSVVSIDWGMAMLGGSVQA